MGGCSGRRYASIEIGAILKARSGSTAVPIYQCGAAERQAVRRPGSVVGIPFLILMSRSRFWNARCALSVVLVPVVQGVGGTPVVLSARGAGRGRQARCAEGSFWAA